MKRCPTCKRTFEDSTLNFCLDDGTPLVAEESEETLVLPSRSQTTVDRVAPGPSYPQPTPPGGYASRSPQRSVWPWALAIVAVLLVGAAVIVAVAVIVPQLVHPRDTRDGSPTPAPSRSPSPTPTPTRSPVSDVPTDYNEVKSQLEDIEEDWERANAEADKGALDKILADEYAGDNNATKKNYVQTISPNPQRRWRYSNFVLTLAGERATLRYHLDRIDGDTVNSYDYGDTFVWRDHRWQATSSHQVK